MDDQSQGVFVLGAGRSGTSMLTRVINLLGVDIGTNLIRPDRTNPKGFWEDKEIVNIHEELFGSLGGRNTYLSQYWEENDRFKLSKQKLKQYIESNFSGKRLWGIKDPRMPHFLHLWKELLKELNIDAHYIIIVRNPYDVFLSFKTAYGSEKEAAMRLWKLRTLLSLKDTQNEKRVMIDYDQFLDNPLVCLRRISNACNIPWPQNEKILIDQLHEFIDSNLQHSRTRIEELLSKEDFKQDIKETYRLCYEACHSSEFINTEEFKRRVEELF